MLNILPTQPDPSQQPIPTMPKMSEHKGVDFLLNIAKVLKLENESEKSKTNARTIVQMLRRMRGKTAGDAFGFWKGGAWIEGPSFENLHNVPIFQQLVVGAEANFAQADIRLGITANSKSFADRAAEKICKGVYEILNSRQWTETMRQQAFYAAILKLNAYYISRFNKDQGMDIPLPSFEPQTAEIGGFGICTNCYETTELSGVMANACQACGNDQFTIIDDPQMVQNDIVSEFGAVKSGDTEVVVADGLDVSVDPYGLPADICSMRWVEYRETAQKDELKRLYPHLNCGQRPDWSYQTRLKKAFIRLESGEYTPTTEAEKNEYEIRHIWLDKTEYEGYVCPDDFKIGQEVVCSRGEKLVDRYPDGIVFGVVGQEIAYLDAENKNKRIASSLWITDGTSPEGLGAKSGLPLQRMANQLENIIMQGVTRSLNGSLVYDPSALQGSHLEGSNTNIPLKPDFALAGNPIKNFIMPIDVKGLSQEVLLYQEKIKQTMQEVMGIPDVMLGQDTSSDKTYGGQALRSRHALGLLTPKTQSTARAKELWLAHQLDLIQTFYSPTALRQMGAQGGQEWLDDEIAAFFEADLDKAITIAYVPGTEIPESRFEKQMRLREDVAAGFVPLTPELQQQMALEGQYGVPTDVNGYESNLQLFEKRYEFIQESVEANQLDMAFELFESQMVDPMTGQPLDPSLVNPVVGLMMASPELMIFDYAEDPGLQSEFWARKVRELAAADIGRSPALLAMSNAMLRRHRESGMKQMTVDMIQQGTAQAAGAAPGNIGQRLLDTQMPEPPKPQEAKPKGKK